MKYQTAKKLVVFADNLSTSVGVLQHFGCSNDLFSTSSLEKVTGKLPLHMRCKWFGNIENTQNRSKPPSLMKVNTSLQKQAVMHERLFSSMTSNCDTGKSHGDFNRNDSKYRSSNFETCCQ